MGNSIMAPVYKSMPTGPWIKGVNSATDPYSIPKGAAYRLSNMTLRRRGALHTIDGSLIISAVNGIIQPTNQGPIEALFLFQPTGVNPYYVDLQLDALYHLGAPTGLTVSASGSGSALLAGTYYYVVTAIDGLGGETTKSSEVSVVNSGGQVNVLTWNPVNFATGYNIYRSTSSGSEIFLTSVTNNSYADTGAITPGMTYNLASSSRNDLGGGRFLYAFVTTLPNTFKVGSIVTVAGVTPSAFNQNYQVGAVFSSTRFNSTTQFGHVTSITGTGGTVTGGVTPPATDTTQVVVMRVLPTAVTNYNESSIVAVFASTASAVLVNPPGSGGSGGGTMGGGPGPGGGGGPVPGPGGGSGLPL
jgi:hypothetical protein